MKITPLQKAHEIAFKYAKSVRGLAEHEAIKIHDIRFNPDVPYSVTPKLREEASRLVHIYQRPAKEFAGMLPDGYIRPGILDETRADKLASYLNPSDVQKNVKKASAKSGNSLRSYYIDAAGAAGVKPKNIARGGIINLSPTSKLSDSTGSVGRVVRSYANPSVARKALRRHEIVHSILQQRRGGTADTVAKLAGEEFTAYSKQLLGPKAPDKSMPIGARIGKLISGTIESTNKGRKTLGLTKWLEGALTHPTLGMALKNFQLPHDYATQPDSSERREFIKTGILGAGIAAGAGIGALALRGVAGKAARNETARNAVNRVVTAQRNAKIAREGVVQEAQAQAAKEAKGAFKAKGKAYAKDIREIAKNPNLTKGEKEKFKSAHARWKEANAAPTEFDTVIREKRDGLSKARDGALLAGGLGVLGAAGYAGFKARGAAKAITSAVREHAPAISSKVNAALDQATLAASHLKVTGEQAAHAVAPSSDMGKLYKSAKGAVHNILDPVNTAKETHAGWKAGLAATPLSKPGDSLMTRIKNAKQSFVSGFNAPVEQLKTRPKWALSANLKAQLKEFSRSRVYYCPQCGFEKSYHRVQQQVVFCPSDNSPMIPELNEFSLQTDEDGIPLNGRVAHDRFIKQIRESDLDRRDHNMRNAGVAGAVTGALVPSKKLGIGIRAALGAAAGGASVLGVRAVTDHKRDIYGDRPRWAKTAETVPAAGGAAAAAILAAKKAKLFAAIEKADPKTNIHPALKAALLGAGSGVVLGAIPGLKIGSTLAGTAASIGKGALLGGALAGGGTAIGTQILGHPQEGEGAPIMKRAALGGAIAGGVLGTAGVLAARKAPRIAKAAGLNLGSLAKTWRPAAFVKNASLPAAALSGAGAGAIIGGTHAADEGQEVDTVNAIQEQKPKTFQSQVQGLLKEFGYSDQTRNSQGRWRNPVREKLGLDDDAGTAVPVRQSIQGFYNQGKAIHRWGGRGSGIVGDATSVIAGNPRDRDAAGRPRKREWEKAWFKNTVGAAAGAAALYGAAKVTKDTAVGRKHILPLVKKADDLGKKYGVRLFDQWAEYNGWDVRDPRGRSARVFAPGSRPRVRREKDWHEKKENRELLLKVAAGAVGAAGVGAGIVGARAHAGLPINPFKNAGKGIFDLKGKPVAAAAKGPRYQSTSYPTGHHGDAVEEIRRKGLHIVEREIA